MLIAPKSTCKYFNVSLFIYIYVHNVNVSKLVIIRVSRQYYLTLVVHKCFVLVVKRDLKFAMTIEDLRIIHLYSEYY